jgi:hypothetical protein
MKSSALRTLRAYARLLSAGTLVIPCFVARFGKFGHLNFTSGLTMVSAWIGRILGCDLA